MSKSVIVLSVIFATTVYGATFNVQKAQMVGIDSEDSQTITELIKSSIKEDGKNEVVASGGNFTLTTKVMKLGSAYVVTMEKRHGDKAVFSTQMKAARFEEMDNVVNRLVHAVINEVAVNKDVTVKDVTETESITGVRRKETVNRWYIGLGPAAGMNTDGKGALFNLAFGYFFEIDPSWALKVAYDATGSSMGYLALGANHYFSNRDRSPMVMAEAGYGVAYSQRQPTSSYYITESVSGFVLGFGYGYQFFRTSKVNLEILAHAAFMMNNNDRGVPGKAGLRIGIYW